MFSELPEFRQIDEITDFFRLVSEGIAAQALAGQYMRLDEAKKEKDYTYDKGAETAVYDKGCRMVGIALTGLCL
jgi:hypothetical protein